MMLSGLAVIYTPLLSPSFSDLHHFSLLQSFISQYFCLPPSVCFSLSFFFPAFSPCFFVIIRLDLSPFSSTGLQFNFVVESHILYSRLCSSPLLHSIQLLTYSPVSCCTLTHSFFFSSKTPFFFYLSPFSLIFSLFLCCNLLGFLDVFSPLPLLSLSLSCLICRGTAQINCSQHETRTSHPSRLQCNL